MKPINELLGFAVLTSPLWLILIVLVASIWIARKAAKRFTSRSTRFAVAVGVFLLVFCVPFADEIAGRIYLNHLCATEAGVKVYRSVELPAEYWDEGGRPRFFNEHGYLDHKFWVDMLDESGGRVERYSSILAIDKDTTLIRKKSSARILAVVSTFRFWGGWIVKNFNPSSTASASCEFMDAPDFSRNVYSQIFKPAVSTR